jgi:hypothetical protein
MRYAQETLQHYRSVWDKIALILDESTTISVKSVLILHLRSYICGKVTFFLDLIQLRNSDALSMITYLKSCLKSHGFTAGYLAQHLVSICSDGANVMVGSKSGLLPESSRQYPRIIRWHCLCHRIELSVGDTLDDLLCRDKPFQHLHGQAVRSIQPIIKKSESVGIVCQQNGNSIKENLQDAEC